MANIKELTQRPERLTGGHRLCSGCGASIVARHILMATENPVIVGAATGCLEVATTIYPYTAWNVPYIHNAFENVAATISGAESAYRSLKKQGKISKEKDIKFVAFGGDGGTYDIGLQSLSGALERGHNFLYVCYTNEAYMNCLSTDSLIMTEKGLKKITEVKTGDKLYAFNQKSHQLVLKECSGVFDNGTKDVYKLETLHHSIKATSNHPFLVVERNNKDRKPKLVWKKLESLKEGDEVITLKNLGRGKSHKFKFKKTKIGDYKVTHLNEINIPKKSNPDIMKYLGLYVGDGWTRQKKAEVGFALPKKTQARKQLLKIHSKIFGNSVKTDDSYIYVESVNLARFIDSLEFGKGARNKRVPDWVFTLPEDEKEGFLEGLMLSDGYKYGKSWRYVSASKALLKSLRLLLQTMDMRVGKIHTQTKEKGTKCVYRPLLKDSTYGYICFSRKNRWNVEKYPTQYKYQNFLIKNEHFTTEKITSIKLVGKEPTLDLRVEDEHNFIADGIVVHNTGIQRSGATPKGASTTTAPSGKESYGKPQRRKDLTEIVAAHNIPYVAQANIAPWNNLISCAEKAFNKNGPTFINAFALCQRGWRYKQEEGIKIAKLAADTCYWPSYEVDEGKYNLLYKPKNKLPVTEFLKTQGRFKHLFKPGNEKILEEIQKEIDENWEKLLKKCNE